MSPGERRTDRSTLLRLGFVDVEGATAGLTALGPYADGLREAIGHTADPDAALAALLALAAVTDRDRLLDTLAHDVLTADRLLAVLGASRALAEHLLRVREDWQELADPLLACTRPPAFVLRAELLAAVGASPDSSAPVATLPDGAAVDALRLGYRRLLLRLAARDLAHGAAVEDVAAELSDLAAATLEAALAIARARVGAAADDVRLAIIAMGKCGGRELNYVSDVDVVFVHEPGREAEDASAGRTAAALASHVIRICSEQTAAGTIWPVDANLRPEGSQGPLSRTLASHRAYYERWAKTWEFQALLKARPVAGDAALGAAYREMVEPFIWQAVTRPWFVEDVQAMRRRVVAHLPAQEAERQLKLGSGGLRDVEFAVQLLQLVHGRADPAIRDGGTLPALEALTSRGYVGRSDGQALQDSWRFLRRLEHRIQLHRLRRTHVVPDDPDELRRIGRSLGLGRDAGTELERQWRSNRREVRRLHEKLFYRPLLGAASRLPGDGAVLSAEAARARLAALGYDDPAAALRHLEALTSGLSRAAAIQRTLLPVMLEWFADAPDPDAGLLGFRRISEALGTTTWYLRLLRDEGEVAERMARLLATSRYATDLLHREPQGVRVLAEDLHPLGDAAILAEMRSVARRQPDAAAGVRAIRAVRRRELLRIAAGSLVGDTDVAEVGAGLSGLTDATLEAALEVVMADLCRQRGFDEPPTHMALVAMGRYGGAELSFGSDADVMFVHEPLPGVDASRAAAYAQGVALELRRLLGLPGSDPALDLDADLRPEGRQGPLVRTLDSYAAYYASWSSTWEAQALLRAEAVVGDADLRARFTALVDPLRFPDAGLDEEAVFEVRRLKARVDAERLPRGADPHTHLKLGRGGLADIEWTVQLLQMQHAGRHPELRTPRTLKALQAAESLGLLDADDAQDLVLAWRLVSRVRDAVTLVRGRPGDAVPSDARERAAVAAVLGYAPGEATEMLNDYLRATRRARAVVDRVFWG
ncbi:bifunctional [glutamine synthetase] adenylyltransferase/[glutamine synthetase]-adenylyl-L-tyrosine phosphorylase [Nocardioides jiangxiensis]|uniref:Bifunctional glutamine synthetase adenylyltransferase/adenylyl-removing enzyme n=1 Tax=Nocardioides jiangxiensis TaxID=3064524 RepID=A0ABT9AXK2_9ACTN|nr:bifunctional [glutamine synthetase] adenylyltransferase/[glutamine synthetase]-adenylyl-L-tyrosine phosphorylase [Nocardioides sp. WY-20]MDO7867097.1 bifunctional [glutamine synthetase] adenylyltransferase/[glutamine synthetase]-adenylyl-L-tyrosine phosphorylase [Nocardioides sp. WY-20]